MAHPDRPENTTARPLSAAGRGLLILLVAVATLAVGHVGTRLARGDSWRASWSGRVGPVRVNEQAGREPADLPPPPRSERAHALAAPDGPRKLIFHYLCPQSPAELVAFYRRELPARGWTERRTAGEAESGFPGALLWYSNNAGNSCMIGISSAEGGTSVTVIRQ